MGKGDKKSRRGKIVIGSYGVRRPKKKGNAYRPEEVKKTSRKKVAEKKETVEEKATLPADGPKKASPKKAAAKPTTKKAEIKSESVDSESIPT